MCDVIDSILMHINKGNIPMGVKSDPNLLLSLIRVLIFSNVPSGSDY